MGVKYFFRFKEMDGDWSPWALCTYEEYVRYSSLSDVETTMRD